MIPQVVVSGVPFLSPCITDAGANNTGDEPEPGVRTPESPHGKGGRLRCGWRSGVYGWYGDLRGCGIPCQFHGVCLPYCFDLRTVAPHNVPGRQGPWGDSKGPPQARQPRFLQEGSSVQHRSAGGGICCLSATHLVPGAKTQQHTLRSSTLFRPLFLLISNELQRNRVDTVAQSCRRGPIIEYMAKVGTAPAA